ncbi:hypothetical protein [uncultured Dokdonia sp.]|uniref:hypothetical protein n=1 Tax=uncultured Dokdonia sp. TaxID=575653 RepID=UPI00262D5308|nr:hypothetical protein [uncultured Dokdonia sp.]
MIDDPLFAYMYPEEDHFFGSRKKRKRRQARRKAKQAQRAQSPKVLARKARQKTFFKKVGNVYRDIGGATAIGQAVDTLVNPSQTDSSHTPSDYEIGLLSQEEKAETSSKNKGVPMAFFIISGVLVLGVVGLIMYKKRQS